MLVEIIEVELSFDANIIVMICVADSVENYRRWWRWSAACLFEISTRTGRWKADGSIWNFILLTYFANDEL